MRINNNVAAFNANRNLSTSNMSLGKSLEKLSSGFRINRAGDDAAGLTISQGLRAQASGLQQATRNAQDGISVVQTAEGALTEVHSMLNRMRDLAVQANNTGTNDATAVDASEKEYIELANEIDRISQTTSFGSKKLLNGSFGASHSATGAAVDYATGATGGDITFAFGGDTTTVTITAGDSADDVVNKINDQVGSRGVSASVEFGVSGAEFTITGGDAFVVAGAGVADIGTPGTLASTGSDGATFQIGANNSANDRIEVSISSMTTVGLSIDKSVGVLDDAGAAIDAIDAAIAKVSDQRSELGAKQNRFESTINNLQVSTENIVASESRIRDTDMATEMTNFTKQQILQQAGTAMLGQANSLPQGVLRLLG